MPKFRKKPVVIEAWEWQPDSKPTDAPMWFFEQCQARQMIPGMDKSLSIVTLEGTMRCEIGDYIIKGVKGEFYPCKPDIFAATYEPADAPAGDNLKYAARLAAHLANTHFPKQEWQPLDTMMGILSQIDNMVTAWNPAPAGDLVSREEAAKVADICTCGSGPEWRSENMRYHAANCSKHIATMIRALPAHKEKESNG